MYAYIYIYIHVLNIRMYVYIYIYDFRGFYSRVILIFMGGIPMPIGNFPESLSQAILVGIM